MSDQEKKEEKDLPLPPEIYSHQMKMECFELRKAGWSLRQIANKMGVKTDTVHKWITRAIEKESKESVLELIALESARYDEILKSYWELAVKHKNFKAGELILKLFERKAKLLGLDAPEKQVRVQIGSLDEMSQEELLVEAKKLGLPIPQFLPLEETTILEHVSEESHSTEDEEGSTEGG